MKKLFIAKMYHKRFFPRVNEFINSGFYIKFNIDKSDELNSLFFKVNKFGLFSFYNKDHGYRDGSSLKEWALEKLSISNVRDVDRIELQTFPRVLGYVFNPVSFWYCYKGDQQVAIINEVNNTFGQSHVYIVKSQKVNLNKMFHVSPFLDVKGHYEFNFLRENSVKIDFYEDNKLKLKTSITGKEVEWTDKQLFKLFLSNPLYTFGIVFHIHYQALKLFVKRVKFYTLPKKTMKDVTYE